MHRRHFLSTSLMAVTAFTGSTTANASPSTPAAAPVPEPVPVSLTEAQFRGLLGTRFQFTGEEWRGPLELTDVISRASDTRVEQFTTIFRTDGPARPAAGVYDVNHPEMGRFALRIDGRHESDRRVATFALLRG